MDKEFEKVEMKNKQKWKLEEKWLMFKETFIELSIKRNMQGEEEK